MATQSGSKTSRLVRQFKSSKGELTPRVHEDVVTLVFSSPDVNGKSIEVPLSSFPEGIRNAAMAYGLNTTIGSAMGNLEDAELDDPDHVIGAISERIKSLQAGKWAGERSGGGRPSIIWMAFVDWRRSKGVKDDEAKLASLHTNWFEDETNFKKLQANPEFAVFLAGFKASRKKPDAQAANAELLA